MSDVIKEAVNKFRRTKVLTTKKEVSIKLLKMTAGLSVAKQLLSVIAPAVGGTIDGLRHDDYIHGAPKSFSHLSLVLVDQIDKLKIVELVTVLLDEMYIDGNEVDIDEYFSANYGELIEILEFALRENFSTFFTGKGIKARFLTTIQTLMASTQEE